MDNLQGQILQNLPPGLLDHVTNHSATYWTVYQRFMAFQAAFRSHLLNPLYTSVLSPLFASLSANPDLATIAIFLVILLVSLKILNMLYRSIIWWLSLITRLVFWSAILGAALWIWQRGAGGAVNDVDAWSKEWSRNYDYWQQRELNARNAQGAGAAGVRRRGGAWWTGR